MDLAFKIVAIVYSAYWMTIVASSSIDPRVVTDRKAISRKGVLIDYSYNETGGIYESAPGCPRSMNGWPWKKAGSPRRCFLTGYRGPCEKREIFMPKEGSSLGVCACDCLKYDMDSLQKLQEPGRYLYCPFGLEKFPRRGQIFDKLENKCYLTFVEGSEACDEPEMISDWTTETITCLPKCDEEEEDWRSLRDEGACAKEPRKPKKNPRLKETTYRAFGNSLPPHKCDEGLSRSEIFPADCNKSARSLPVF